MRKKPDPETPITVLVGDGRWDVFDSPTPRNIMLTQILKGMGGIADTVPPGTYHFNVQVIDGKTIATLYRA